MLLSGGPFGTMRGGVKVWAFGVSLFVVAGFRWQPAFVQLTSFMAKGSSMSMRVRGRMAGSSTCRVSNAGRRRKDLQHLPVGCNDCSHCEKNRRELRIGFESVVDQTLVVTSFHSWVPISETLQRQWWTGGMRVRVGMVGNREFGCFDERTIPRS